MDVRKVMDELQEALAGKVMDVIVGILGTESTDEAKAYARNALVEIADYRALPGAYGRAVKEIEGAQARHIDEIANHRESIVSTEREVQNEARHKIEAQRERLRHARMAERITDAINSGPAHVRRGSAYLYDDDTQRGKVNWLLHASGAYGFKKASWDEMFWLVMDEQPKPGAPGVYYSVVDDNGTEIGAVSAAYNGDGWACDGAAGDWAAAWHPCIAAARVVAVNM